MLMTVKQRALKELSLCLSVHDPNSGATAYGCALGPVEGLGRALFIDATRFSSRGCRIRKQ